MATDLGKQTAYDAQTLEHMCKVVAEQNGVFRIGRIHTRQFDARTYVDVEIVADGSLTLLAGHEIAEQVHYAIERNFPEVKYCMVHVNPCEKKDAEKNQTS